MLAVTSDAPVNVTTCSSELTNAGQFGGGPTLTIGFTNTSSKTISSIVFGISDGQGTQVALTDAGTFKSGEAIHHTFNSPVSRVSGTQCVVREVTFADGGTWVAASPH